MEKEGFDSRELFEEEERRRNFETHNFMKELSIFSENGFYHYELWLPKKRMWHQAVFRRFTKEDTKEDIGMDRIVIDFKHPKYRRSCDGEGKEDELCMYAFTHLGRFNKNKDRLLFERENGWFPVGSNRENLGIEKVKIWGVALDNLLIEVE